MSDITEDCAGGIVLGDSGTLALVWSKNAQTWLFPKGRIEAGESDEEAARREVTEETGITELEYLDDLGDYTREGQDGYSSKHVRMFLFAAPQHAKLSPTLEIEKAEWFSLQHVMQVLGEGKNVHHFQADRAWFTTVFERVRQAIQRD